MSTITPGGRGQPGFTILELSIVLVIIGLIAGGIMAGRDLIEAAKIRGTISQYEQYKVKVKVFFNKYNGLPGDLTASQASMFGFSARPGTPARGDGNGLIESQSSGGGGTNLKGVGGEEICFWDDLGQANLLGFQPLSWECPSAMTYPDGSGADINLGSQAMVPKTFPTAKLERNNWLVYSTGGANYYLLAGLDADYNPQMVENSLTPQQAFAIDTKLDDGLPLTGSVQALSGTTSGMCPLTCTFMLNTIAVPAAPAAGVCVSNEANSPYNVTTSYTDMPSCQLRFTF